MAKKKPIAIPKGKDRPTVTIIDTQRGRASRRSRPRILVAGLGNLLLCDDGVGAHVVQALQRAPIDGVVVAEVGTAVLRALHLLESADQILAIDAMKAGGLPGAVYVTRIEECETRTAPDSLHQLTLVEAFNFLPRHRRPEIVVLGIEPGVIDYGMELSAPVAAALPRVIAAARSIIACWRQGRPFSHFLNYDAHTPVV